ncbi:MAG: sodium:proton exchanger [Flavobacteriales bacterium]|nr:sodium:proton exchanger [Flavobacteriales bacterium]|tara:strand:- start:2076 stop:3890 length:1815 start_codon:yes stop_codon:yes gene_type:complete
MLELAAIIVLGILAQWIAWRMRIPAIFPLIIIGLFVGPLSILFLENQWINPENIFAGKTMYYFVSLSVGVILFEGGLTLKFKEVRKIAGVVRNLLIIGSLIMLIGGALAAHYILEMDYRVGLLFGSLIIVTGPTVIAPILQSVRPNRNVSTILKWEGIIIDPIGALVAVLVYELFFVASMGVGHHDVGLTQMALKTFFLTVCVGSFFGLFSGWALNTLLRKNLIPHFLINVLSLAFVIFAFAGADSLQPESGLLSVTVMGIFLANVKTPNIDKILDFKESLTVILISVLFIILASNLKFEQLLSIEKNSLYVFLIVVFLLRPLVVWLSALGSNLNWREKAFIAWIGPKGIVAAAVASLFSLYLLSDKINLPEELRSDVELLVPLTFMIILGTVTLNGLSAKPVAKLLGVIGEDKNGFLIVGANEGSISIAKYLENKGFSTTLIDLSSENVRHAKAEGLNAEERNILAEENEDLNLEDAGYVLALTSSNDVNIFACRKLKIDIGERIFRLITANEIKFSALTRPKNILFGEKTDYIEFIELVRRYPDIQEIEINDQEHLEKLINKSSDDFIPLLVQRGTSIMMITVRFDYQFVKGDKLAFIGKLN